MNLKKKLKYWCRTSFKRITIVFLLAFTQFQMVYANTVAGGWSFTNPVSQGASTAWDATKNMGDKVAKGVASIKPTPSQVAKGILKGGLVGAALTATEQLLEDGVDFVLDPANNTIRFTKKNETNCTSNSSDCTNSEYLYHLDGSNKYFTLNQIKNNLQSIITWIDGVYYVSHTEHFNFINVNLYRKDLNTIGSQTMYLSRNPAYQPKQETLPIETVASKIIDNADANDKEAEDYVNAVAQDSLENDEATQQMAISQADNSAKIQPPKGVPSTSENSANATPPPDDEDEQNSQDDSQEKIDNLLKDAKPGRSTKGRTTQYIKNGGFDRANKEFDSLKLKNIKHIEPGRMGFLKNNTKVVVRSRSSEGSPTLEIQMSKNNKIEIRYKP